MFTGIISSVQKIVDTSTRAGSIYARIAKPRGWNIKLGDSISVDGVCSTVKSFSKGFFEVEYMPETIKKTTVSIFKKGAPVNLERPLRANERLDGHIVQGHVDTTGVILEVKKARESVVLKIRFPKEYRKFIAEKGSVCLNGVSLTVVAVGKNWCTVSLVSYTLEHTNLGRLKAGDKINIEIDIIARYLDALKLH